jgi:hypothetical protein
VGNNLLTGGHFRYRRRSLRSWSFTMREDCAEADAYLASFGDPTGTAARRADLITELRERLPGTALANEVIEGIASRTGGG